MKKLNYLLILFLLFFGCKKEEIPVRTSPINFFDEIELNIYPYSQILFSDKNGNNLGCQTILPDDDYIIIPDSINQYDGYHLTQMIAVQGFEGLIYDFITYTNIKTNKIKINDLSNSNQNFDIPLKRVKVEVETNSTTFVDFIAVQERELQSSHIRPGNSINMLIYTHSDYYFLTVKLQNENSIRYKKIFFPSNNEKIVVNIDSMTKTDSRTITDFPEKFYKVTTLGIENCNELASIPIGFYDNGLKQFHLSNTDSFSFEKYITQFDYFERDSIDSILRNYYKLVKGKLPQPFNPLKFDLYFPHPEVDQFQMVITKSNLIVKTNWSTPSTIFGGANFSWQIYGDFYGGFKAPELPPDCLPFQDFFPTANPILNSVTVYESSDYSNYEEFLMNHFNNEIPFYLKNNCDTVEDEYLTIQTINY